MSRSPLSRVVPLLIAAILSAPFLGGCTTNAFSLRQSTHSDAYMIGYIDGRYSGLNKGGNSAALVIKDGNRFREDEAYRKGWLEGEQEGLRIQRESGVVANQARVETRTESIVDSRASDSDDGLLERVIQPQEASSLKF